jgi:hypothetical protein
MKPTLLKPHTHGCSFLIAGGHHNCERCRELSPAHGSANLGEFTKASGQVRQCRAIWLTRRGLLKVQYVERGQTLVGYITPNEFRPDSPNGPDNPCACTMNDHRVVNHVAPVMEARGAQAFSTDNN